MDDLALTHVCREATVTSLIHLNKFYSWVLSIKMALNPDECSTVTVSVT